MEPNKTYQQPEDQAGQGIGPLPGGSSLNSLTTPKERPNNLMALEVMNLVYEVTLTSAEIYELVAILAECILDQQSDLPSMHPPIQEHLTPLLTILSGTQKSEVRVRLLEMTTQGIQTHELDEFLQACGCALDVFNEVGRSLAGVIGLDEWAMPTITASETLVQVMKRLDACSQIISSLPNKGLEVSSRCLVETVFNLQHCANDLAVKSLGPN